MNWGHWGNIRDVGGTLRGQWGTLGGTEDNGECWGAQGTVGNTGGTLGPMGEMGAMGALGGSHPHQRGSLGGRGGQKPLPLPILGPLGSALSTRYGARPVVMAGGFLAGMGFLLGAFATRLSHLYLSVGLLAGMLDDLERGVPWVRGGRYRVI